MPLEVETENGKTYVRAGNARYEIRADRDGLQVRLVEFGGSVPLNAIWSTMTAGNVIRLQPMDV